MIATISWSELLMVFAGGWLFGVATVFGAAMIGLRNKRKNRNQ